MAKIKSIEAWNVAIPLRIGFAHARFHHQTHRAVLLRITVEGLDKSTPKGYGESIPRVYLSGETPETVVEWIRNYGRAWLGVDLSIDPRQRLYDLFDQVQTKGGLAAFSGLDVAIHDLWSQVIGKDLISLLGGPLTPIIQRSPLSGPVGLGPLQAAQVLGFYTLGFRRIKIKISDPQQWQNLLGSLPRSMGDTIKWVLDANGALGWEDAQVLMEKAVQRGIAAVEEPLAKSEASYQQILNLCRQVSGPMRVIVDEHLCTLEDGKRWKGSPVIRNLRLAKIGGFTGLVAHLSLQEQGISTVMLGALVGESPLLEAATRVALGLTQPVFTESSFGSLILKKSPFRRIFHGIDQEWLRAKAFPAALAPMDQGCLGLGVAMDEDVVKKYHTQYLKLIA